MRIVPKIIREHVSLTAFLWSQRASLLADDPPDIEAVLGVEQRLKANIDALRIAGVAAWDLAVEQFEEYPEAGEMFVLGLLVIWISEDDRTSQTLELARDHTAARPGLIGALTWLQPLETAAQVRKWLGSGDSLERFLAVSTLAEHNADVGARLSELLEDEDPETAGAACRLAAMTKRKDCLPALRKLSKHKDEALAFAAAWACSELGDSSGTGALQHMATSVGPHALTALRSLIENQPKDQTRLWLGSLNQLDDTKHIAVRGAGMMGDRSALAWLVGCMSDSKLAVAAGAAFLELHGPLEEIDDHFFPDAGTAANELGPDFAKLKGRIPRAVTFFALLDEAAGKQSG